MSHPNPPSVFTRLRHFGLPLISIYVARTFRKTLQLIKISQKLDRFMIYFKRCVVLSMRFIDVLMSQLTMDNTLIIYVIYLISGINAQIYFINWNSYYYKFIHGKHFRQNRTIVHTSITRFYIGFSNVSSIFRSSSIWDYK